jgi:hypothetical protein
MNGEKKTKTIYKRNLGRSDDAFNAKE